MILEPITPTMLSVRRLPHADPALVTAYGGDPARHASLGLVTCDQDDAMYVALDEATKHAPVDVIFAHSFYAGSAHASGRLSGEILGVLAASEPEAVEHGLVALLRCLAHDACFYDADGKRTVTVFPHVITSLGEYLSREAGLPPGAPMAYLVAPPIVASTPPSRPPTSAPCASSRRRPRPTSRAPGSPARSTPARPPPSPTPPRWSTSPRPRSGSCASQCAVRCHTARQSGCR